MPQKQLQLRRALPINCVSDAAAKQDDRKWFRADNPNEHQKKKMLAMHSELINSQALSLDWLSKTGRQVVIFIYKKRTN